MVKQTAQRRLCDLVLDYNIYPRNQISDININFLFGAIQSEHELPLMVVEKGSARILDGVHRWKALTRHLGADATVDVIERACRDDNEAFLIAIELNSTHGLHLTPQELTNNVCRAETRGISLEAVAKAAHVPPSFIQRRLTENTAFARVLGMPDTRVALKRSMKGFAGMELNEQQVETNRIAGGMSPTYYIHFVQKLIESGLWEHGSMNERSALSELFAVMRRVMTDAA